MPENSDVPRQDKLYSLLSGKNTLEASHILADVFVACFGERWGARGEILKLLLPRGRANTWSDLDRHINSFCKQFYLSNKQNVQEQNSKAIQFLDNVRFVIESLPQRHDYKPDNGKEEYRTPQEAGYHFVMCSLCWRAVARRPLEKKTPLCHLHDLPSTNAEYRRRARMKLQVELTRFRLVKALPTLWELRQERKPEQEYKADLNNNIQYNILAPQEQPNTDLNTYLLNLCLNPDGPLPHLARYLHSLSSSPLNFPLQTPKDILQALEYPVYLHKLPSHIQEAWNCYLNDRSKHFRLNYVKILTAEAWLQENTKRKHGGKRR
jgi:hypothetical protein